MSKRTAADRLDCFYNIFILIFINLLVTEWVKSKKVVLGVLT